MNLTELREEIKKAMIEKRDTGNSNKYMTLKSILEKSQKIAKEQRKENEISDSMIIDSARKEIKQLQELKEFYEVGTRELSQEEKKKVEELDEKISVAKELLPQMIEEEVLLDFIMKNKNDISNIGQGMKILSNRFGDCLDKKIASKLLKQYL